MKKLILCGIAGLVGAACSFAATLTPEQALARLQNSGAKRMPAGVSRVESMKHESTVGNLYIFSSGKGFAVLPDDDGAPALLAFSDADNFSLDGNPELKYWLDCYNSELQYLKAHKAGNRAADTSWRTDRPAIQPLLTTEWNQESPYNMLCPKVDGRETVTGCVATAMAQVMKYHNYPAHGKGTHSYLWRPGEEELTFDYENTPFQWTLMTDRYDRESSEESRKAVAELMLACGISVDMHYEPGGSGAATTRMGEALIDIFDYSPALWMPNRVFYGYDEWEGMIYDDLAQGLPVLYSGAGTAGGHQFVCDGYAGSGYFHFNWGWGGLSNGYFLLTALNPDDLGVGGGAGGFNSSQIASLGVRPAKAGDKPVYVMYNTIGFVADAKEVRAGEPFRCSGLYYNYSLASLPEGARLGMKIASADGKDVRYAEGPDVGGMHLDDGRENDQIRFPELPDGKYYITPALHADGKWSEVRMPVGYPGVVTATVTDKVAAIESQAEASIVIKDIDIPAHIYRNHEFPMPFTIDNTGDLEFYASVTPYILDAEGTAVAKSKFRPADVLPGSSERIGDYIAEFSAIDGREFPAGDYRLIFRDEHGRAVSDTIDVSIDVNTDATEIKITDFRLDDTNPVADPAAVKFVFTVECEAGVYFGTPHIAVFPADGGYEMYHKSAREMYLTPGEHREAAVTADLDHLKDGHYMALVYNGGRELSSRVYFTIDRVHTGIENVDTPLNATSTIYTIDGIERHTPLSAGIYIIDGRKTLVR